MKIYLEQFLTSRGVHLLKIHCSTEAVENKNLESFLEAMIRYTEDFQG